MRLADLDLKLVLAGGGALGAYQAGVYEVLHEAGLAFGHLCGASTGAVNAVLVASGERDGAVGRLRAFWDAVAEPLDLTPPVEAEGFRRAQAHLAGVRARLFGRSALHRMRFAELLASGGGRPGLYDLDPAVATLCRLVDFGRLRPGGAPRHPERHRRRDRRGRPVRQPRAPAGARARPGQRLHPARLPAARGRGPPGRRRLQREPAVTPGRRPAAAAPRRTLDGMAERRQDLLSTSQTRAVIEAVAAQTELAALRADRPVPPAPLVHLVYRGDDPAGAQRIYDYSQRTVAERWRCGVEDARAMLAAPAEAPEPTDGRLTILRFPSHNARATAAARRESG